MDEIKKIENILIRILPSILSILFILILGYIVMNHKLFSVDENELMTLEPIFFSIAFILILISLVLGFNEFKRYFGGIRKETWMFLISIVILGFCLRQFVVPHTHRIFFDEDLYSGIANSIATEGRNILCNYGTPTKCTEGILNKDPSGWPFFLSIFYRIFGSSESLAFSISTSIGTLSILLVFLVSYLLFKNKDKRDEEIALFAALLFALTPAHIIWSGSIATEVPFAFFSLMTILAYLLYFKGGKFYSHLLAASLLAFTVQIRPEGVIFIFPIIFAFLLFERGLLKKLTDYRFWIPWVLFFLLITPHLIHMYIKGQQETWGAPNGKRLGLEYIPHNLSVNTMFWFTGDLHPVFFTILSLIGLFYLLPKGRKIFLFNLVWFLTFFTLFVLFYAGGVDNGGIGFRFINIYFMPVVIIGGYGAFVLGRLLTKFFNGVFKGILFILNWLLKSLENPTINISYNSLKIIKKIFSIFASLMVISSVFISFLFFSDIPYTQFTEGIIWLFDLKPESSLYKELKKAPFHPPMKPYIMNISNSKVLLSKNIRFILVPDKQAQYARDMHDLLVMPNMDSIPENCYVLTHNPSIFLVEGRNSLQTWFGLDDRVMNDVFEKTDCVMWLEGAWCAVDPRFKKGICKSMHDKYKLTIFARHVRKENPKQVFTIYRVYRK